MGLNLLLSALPLGGYVAFHTEKVNEEEFELAKPNPEQNSNTFESKPNGKEPV